MRRVIVESPFAGDVPTNIRYARACLKDCLKRGEAPYASHLLYTQEGVLDDTIPEERMWGIHAGFEWNKAAEASVVYTDLGISKGMEYGIKNAQESGRTIEYRTIPGWNKERERTIKVIESIRLAFPLNKHAVEWCNYIEKVLSGEEPIPEPWDGPWPDSNNAL